MPYPSDADRLAWERTPEAGWIDSPDGPLFAWYHAPRGTPRDTAILLCETIGSERMNLHLTYRHLALRLSYAGFPVLRFDYAGTGDSSGSDRDGDRVAVWERGLVCAAEALRARSGLAQLSLFGARLGGTLCVRHAARDSEVASIVLWGPYTDGRAFLKAERALERLAAANPSGRRASNAQPGDVESVGFLFNAATVEALQALDLRVLDTSLVDRNARIFAWDADSREEVLASLLTSRGMDVQLTRDARIVSEDSLTRQAIPEILLEQTTSWLLERHGPIGPIVRVGRDASRFPSGALVLRDGTDPTPLHEEAVFFGPDRDLFGIHVKPLGGGVLARASKMPSLILVSGGNNHRAGINRNYTEWSRDAAAAGAHVLRFDIRGLGDSPPLEAAHLNMLYRTATMDDVVAAIDYLTTEAPSHPIVLCGLCAGAFQALHTALRDRRVRGLVLIDILRWELDEPVLPRKGFIDRRRRQINRVIRALSRRTLGRIPRFERSSTDALAESLWSLVSRDVAVSLVAARSAKGYERVTEAVEVRRAALEASGRFRFEVLSDTNHIFSPLWAQEWLGHFLVETLVQLPEVAGGGSVGSSRVPNPLGSGSPMVEEENSRAKEDR